MVDATQQPILSTAPPTILSQQFVLLQSEVLHIAFTQIPFFIPAEKGHSMSHFSESIDVSCTEVEETQAQFGEDSDADQITHLSILL